MLKQGSLLIFLFILQFGFAFSQVIPLVSRFNDSLIALHSSKARANFFLSSGNYSVGNTNHLTYTPSQYVLHMSFGSIKAKKNVIFDTGSAHLWVKCFDPKYYKHRYPYGSKSYKAILCRDSDCPNFQCYADDDECPFSQSYLDHSSVQGHLVRDSVTFENGLHSNILFGCANMWSNVDQVDGICGFASNAGFPGLSFVEQMKIIRFATCLAGPLGLVFLNDDAEAKLKSAKILGSSPIYSSIFLRSRQYHVELEAIELNGRRATPDTSGNVILDSGSPYTMLDGSLFHKVRDYLDEAVSSRYYRIDSEIGDICYGLKGYGSHHLEVFPTLTLHFQGYTMNISASHYVIQEGTRVRVAIGMLHPNHSLGLGIIGSSMQQDHLLYYDLDRGRVHLAQSNCSKAINSDVGLAS